VVDIDLEKFFDRVNHDRLASLMRRNCVTIRALSQRTGITMKRIRMIRERGLSDPHAIRDWIEAITGEDPGSLD